MSHFGLTRINWHVKRVYCELWGWPTYDTFLIMSLSARPVYDLNPLSSNPNLKKLMSNLCRVRRLGRTLTPLLLSKYLLYTLFYLNNICFSFFLLILSFSTFSLSSLLSHISKPSDMASHASTTSHLSLFTVVATIAYSSSSSLQFGFDDSCIWV